MRLFRPGPGAIIGPTSAPDPNADLQFATAAQVAAELAARTHDVVGTATQFGNIAGNDKYGGLALSESGHLILSPYDAANIGIVDPGAQSFNTFNPNGSIALSGTVKYIGQCLTPNGLIFFAPFDDNDVLVYDTRNERAFKLGLNLSGSSRYGAAIYSPVTQKVYLIPYTAQNVAIIDPWTLAVSFTTFGLTLTDTIKWDGAVQGLDGKIYGVPRNATNILIIDPATGTATRSNMGATLTGTGKFNGGCLLPDGKILCPPRDATDFLLIDPAAGTATRTTLGSATALNTLAGTTTDKWRGCKLGLNGVVYCVPSSATAVLLYDTKTGTVSATNFSLTTTGYRGAQMGLDGAVYMCPFDATSVLRIATGTPSAASAASALSPYCNG
jgi:hypothetical protein